MYWWAIASRFHTYFDGRSSSIPIDAADQVIVAVNDLAQGFDHALDIRGGYEVWRALQLFCDPA